MPLSDPLQKVFLGGAAGRPKHPLRSGVIASAIDYEHWDSREVGIALQNSYEVTAIQSGHYIIGGDQIKNLLLNACKSVRSAK